MDPVEMSPDQFELEVKKLLQKSGVGLSEFRVQRREKLPSADGTYEIDITARFETLGANFLVLVECKHHKNPIKREVVQVLYDKLRTVAGHKGMIFATTSFQRGAIEFAQAHGIALVQIADGRTSYLTKAYGVPTELPPWVSPFVGWVVSINDEGHESYKLLENESQVLLERFHCNDERNSG